MIVQISQEVALIDAGKKPLPKCRCTDAGSRIHDDPNDQKSLCSPGDQAKKAIDLPEPRCLSGTFDKLTHDQHNDLCYHTSDKDCNTLHHKIRDLTADHLSKGLRAIR